MYLVQSNLPAESIQLGRDIRPDEFPVTSLEYLSVLVIQGDAEPELEGCHPCEGGGTVFEYDGSSDEGLAVGYGGSWVTCEACKGTGIDARWPA